VPYAQGGPHAGTIHYTTTTNATASFTFQAPAAFSLYYAKYTNRGSFEIRVDGELVETIDPYATARTWQNTYTSRLYDDDQPHTVEIKNISTGGKEVDIDAIRISLPAGVGTYDDIDPEWMYSSGWFPYAQSGPYDGTIHYTTTTNATASFVFQAPAVFTFYYAKYTNRGAFEIWVDGELLTTIDPYATARTWQNTYTSPIYTDDQPHTVLVKNISTGGKEVDIDAIQIAAIPGPAGPDVYDDTDPHWSYSAGWVPYAQSGPHDGTIHYTTTNGATASFTFQAPAVFTFYYAKYTNRGAFEIWVDDELLVTIDPYATTKSWQNIYTSLPYTDDQPHTIEIKNISASGLEVDIDAIQISAP
jgi:hypothetical protein